MVVRLGGFILHRATRPLQLQLGRCTGHGSGAAPLGAAPSIIQRLSQPRAAVPEPKLGPLLRPRQDAALGVGPAVAEVVPD